MNWTQRGRDRRSSTRFDVVGPLHGTVVLPQYVTIHNLGAGGALVDSRCPLDVDRSATVKLISDGSAIPLNARVRHVRRQVPAGYLIGLEFIIGAATGAKPR